MSEEKRGKSLLERGLAEAYGPRNGESVLQVLGALTGEAPRIDLNADPDEIILGCFGPLQRIRHLNHSQMTQATPQPLPVPGADTGSGRSSRPHSHR